MPSRIDEAGHTKAFNNAFYGFMSNLFTMLGLATVFFSSCVMNPVTGPQRK